MLQGLPVLLLMLLPLTVSAQVYQWVDEQGRTHFSDKVPADKSARPTTEEQASVGLHAPVHHDGVALRGLTWDEMAYLRQLLRARQFEVLNSRLDEYRRNADADAAAEPLLWGAYQAFDLGVASAEEYFNDWVRLHPGVEGSYLARASYQSGVAWQLLQEKGRSANADDRKRINGYFFAALGDLDAAIRINPSSAIAYALLVRMGGALNEREQLKSYLDGAERDVPMSFVVARMRLQMLSPAFGGSERTMADYAKRVAARSKQNPLLAFLPGYVDLYMGDLARQQRNNQAALERYNRAINSAGDNHEFFQHRAELLLEMREYEDAIRDFSSAARYNTADSSLYVGEAKAFAAMGQYRNAASELQRARKIDPSSLPLAEFSQQVVKALVKEGQQTRKAGDAKEAATFLEAAIGLSPKNGDAVYEYSQALSDLQRFSEAQQQLEAAFEGHTDELKHYRLMEQLLLRRYQWDEVVGYWSMYIDRHGEDAASLEARARAYYGNHQYEKALDDAEKAAALGNKSAKALVKEYSAKVNR